MNSGLLYPLLTGCTIVLAGCSTTGFISKTAKRSLLNQSFLKTAHIGISIYDVSSAKYLYNYQENKYFVPASNTKIFTLYAGLKYLKDSIPGIHYKETADTFFIYPTGDPSLLHPDFKRQPVIVRLQGTTKPVVLIDRTWKEDALGFGWSWSDYNDNYMAERSPLPVYGNVIKWTQVSQKNSQPELQDSMQIFVFSEPEVNWKVRFKEDTVNKTFMVKRKRNENYFEISQGKEKIKEQSVPFVTNGVLSAIELLKDTIHKEIILLPVTLNPGFETLNPKPETIYSQSTDSLFKLMMYRSDNFFAEQILLMASNEKLREMNDAKLIDTLLKSDLKDLPQEPNWVDGSGLSRYNLFTPQDFVWILNKMKNEFGLERLKAILPSGGQGTLGNYYQKDSGYIFAKTGTLSGHVALSGFLFTPKNKLLIFSVLVNNHQSSAAAIRMAVENMLVSIRRKY